MITCQGGKIEYGSVGVFSVPSPGRLNSVLLMLSHGKSSCAEGSMLNVLVFLKCLCFIFTLKTVLVLFGVEFLGVDFQLS